MKAALFALAATPLLGLAAPASAEPSRLARQWIAETNQAIAAAVPPAPGTGPVGVQITISNGRRFESPRLVSSSGSPELDKAVLAAARNHRPSMPPHELLYRKVTFKIRADGSLAQAQAPAPSAAR